MSQGSFPQFIMELASVISGALRTQSLGSSCSQECGLMAYTTKLHSELCSPEAGSFLSLHPLTPLQGSFPASKEFSGFLPLSLLREIPWCFLLYLFPPLCLKLITSWRTYFLDSHLHLTSQRKQILHHTPIVASSLPWPSGLL